MERGMNSLLTPTTAFLYSCLDLEAPGTPQPRYEDPRDNVFDRAFKASNLAVEDKQNALEYTQPSLYPRDVRMTPEGTDGQAFGFQNYVYEFHSKVFKDRKLNEPQRRPI